MKAPPPPSREEMRKVNVPDVERGPTYRLASPLPEDPPEGLAVDDVISLLEPHVKPYRRARLLGVAAQRMHSLTVVLEGLYDPGNRSAVYRSAESFGLLDLHVVNPAAAKKPHARAVSRGAEKWTRIHEWAWPHDAVGALHEKGFTIAVSDLQAETPLQDVPFDRPVALVFGNEHDGITEEMRELADIRFVIPMRGFTESLNISTAAAVTLAHARAARERALGCLTDLEPADIRKLYAAYLRRSVRKSESILQAALDTP